MEAIPSFITFAVYLLLFLGIPGYFLYKRATAVSPQRPRDLNFTHDIVPTAYKAFTRVERHYFLNLPLSTKRVFCDDEVKLSQVSWWPAAHCRFYFKFLLVLKELKPCVLFAHYELEGVQACAQLVERCLNPILQTYDLEEYGFVLRKIEHAVPTEVHRGFEGGWIFADTRSPKWPLVQSVFLTPHPGERQKEFDVAHALGYPVLRPGNEGTMRLKDVTEAEALRRATGKGKAICCVEVLEYFSRGGYEDCRAILRYNALATRAGREVGTIIEIAENDHPGFERFHAMVMAS
ncbi:hypothetical protein K458DRAFT_48335 [Lentithecium fluviatile CBS 122367]|uniref:Uncharacterized protein n=1 Tax=Lentithecium fluviatile CBS 122367 TaxID=1168545 RepID=A0A6G1IXH0_9PLEO|nr:hypothetical protein K458DRAFT_48335 [Lentithecium fluviatile CBS 122367]